jgi:hypothetical protein
MARPDKGMVKGANKPTSQPGYQYTAVQSSTRLAPGDYVIMPSLYEW